DRCGRTRPARDSRSTGLRAGGSAASTRASRTGPSWAGRGQSVPTIRTFFCRIGSAPRPLRKPVESILSTSPDERRGRSDDVLLGRADFAGDATDAAHRPPMVVADGRSEEHTSELQSSTPMAFLVDE